MTDLGLTQVDPRTLLPRQGDLPAFIGRYRILGRLGEGGMGTVYLAEQTEPVRREVAVKVLREAHSEAVIARFDLERQSLAVMEHPGITKVFDAGVTDAGWPYFVMERISGAPITEFADASRLNLAARLRLVIQVCHAIQHAHQKGTIHRDLKPSNILATLGDAGAEAQCKVIDFGIAKAVTPTVGAHLTMTGLSVGTPAYMSPEQATGAGVDIDTRSDIYSLGVVLYELLAGVLPIAIPDGGNAWAIMAQQVYQDAPAPSARFAALPPDDQRRIAAARGLDPASLARVLRGDLDNVVLRTLDKERERRYSSAAALAQDLERYLANEPVLATPPGRGYRMRKFARRHRAAVSFAAAAVALLIGFSITTEIQATRIARASRKAEMRQGQAEDQIRFMVDTLGKRLSAIGRLDVMDAVAAQEMRYFAAVPADQLSDEERFRRSQMLQQLGDMDIDKGKLADAQSAYAGALALTAGLVKRDPSVAEWQIGLGASEFGIGYIAFLQGHADSALASFNRYLGIAQALVARAPDSLSYRQELAEAQSNIGSVDESKGDLPAALAAYKSALETKKSLVAADSTNLDWRLDLSHTYNSVAVIQQKLGDPADAEVNHRAELALRESLVAKQPANWPWVRFVAISHSYLGDLGTTDGSLPDAIAHLRAADSIYERMVAHDPANTEWDRSFANTQRLLGVALVEAGRAADAIPVLDSSRARVARLLTRRDALRDWRQQLSSTDVAESAALVAVNRSQDALRASQRAVGEAAAFHASGPADVRALKATANAQISLGRALEALGQPAAARAAWAAAAGLVDSAATRSHETDLLATDAIALLHLKRLDRAAPIVRELRRRGYRPPSFVALTRTIAQ